ncbi:MAG: sulfotransferase [Chloroflexi bacterium]|nr:sulfotransferase [Chloroflexota bacterium]
MMMQMLRAGGMQILTDQMREADEDNPQGYYEFEPVKQIEHNHAWLEDAQGKVVKMISALLRHLPATYHYRIIFVRRRMEEVLASQRQMLMRRGEPTNDVSDEKLSEIFSRHLQQVEAWLDAQPHMEVLYVDYHHVLQDPLSEARTIGQFLGQELDVAAMATVVDRNLHRQRR